MKPIQLELRFGDVQMAGTAEQLEQIHDNERFMRYQIISGERRSVICIEIEEESTMPLTLTGAESNYKVVHNRKQASAFDEDMVFTPEEVSVIAAEIKAYNDTRKLKFDEMHFDF